jgi:hypothetical protein
MRGQSPSSSSPKLSPGLNLALQLTSTLLCHVFVVHIATFPATVLKQAPTTQVLEHSVPWQDLATFSATIPHRTKEEDSGNAIVGKQREHLYRRIAELKAKVQPEGGREMRTRECLASLFKLFLRAKNQQRPAPRRKSRFVTTNSTNSLRHIPHRLANANIQARRNIAPAPRDLVITLSASFLAYYPRQIQHDGALANLRLLHDSRIPPASVFPTPGLSRTASRLHLQRLNTLLRPIFSRNQHPRCSSPRSLIAQGGLHTTQFVNEDSAEPS